MLAGRDSLRRLGTWGLRVGSWTGLEAAADRKVQVHTLHPLLGLRADDRRLSGVQRLLPLRDESQVGAADPELVLHNLERALAVRQCLREDLLPVARGDLGRQGALDFTECPQPDRGVGGDRLLLL